MKLHSGTIASLIFRPKLLIPRGAVTRAFHCDARGRARRYWGRENTQGDDRRSAVDRVTRRPRPAVASRAATGLVQTSGRHGHRRLVSRDVHESRRHHLPRGGRRRGAWLRHRRRAPETRYAARSGPDGSRSRSNRGDAVEEATRSRPRLFNAVRELADQVSADRIALTTWSFNVEAHRFFEAEGFSTELNRMTMAWPTMKNSD